MSTKAPPKTLHQVRNVVYILSAWLGVQKGFAEKSANDKLWVEHQRKLRLQRLEEQEAADRLVWRPKRGKDSFIDGLPRELQGIAESFQK
ncbi:hypothetical protein ERJ75_000216400 [Trypanosoma vivax]|uniref:Uncharacterized protein n=1 Tax=Trypanosoma vivax (strain Y486) TaxID=1055687 RepID=G0U9S8_TRYVY|nr:hypothetical protein ERJ75_000216400 [Trypanosoma vivax]CCC52559.1 conserved hypothetical protein [Trypanosoma vivax Y486]